jgi:hypothetical protein
MSLKVVRRQGQRIVFMQTNERTPGSTSGRSPRRTRASRRHSRPRRSAAARVGTGVEGRDLAGLGGDVREVLVEHRGALAVGDARAQGVAADATLLREPLITGSPPLISGSLTILLAAAEEAERQ